METFDRTKKLVVAVFLFTGLLVFGFTGNVAAQTPVEDQIAQEQAPVTPAPAAKVVPAEAASAEPTPVASAQPAEDVPAEAAPVDPAPVDPYAQPTVAAPSAPAAAAPAQPAVAQEACKKQPSLLAQWFKINPNAPRYPGLVPADGLRYFEYTYTKPYYDAGRPYHKYGCYTRGYYFWF